MRRLFGLPNEEEDEPAGDERDEQAVDPFTVTGEQPALGQPSCGGGEVDRWVEGQRLRAIVASDEADAALGVTRPQRTELGTKSR